MADAALIKRGGVKVLAFVVVLVLGHRFLWPEQPVMEWLQDGSGNADWKVKFAFLAWAAVVLGMAYDALVALAKGVVATPEKARRR